ncbi:hypothetical protein AZE42_04024 [Rhizopogon vesiculosus]|uniref:Uncharacterized protein n=1 Tax=Rhizopogon vesiculosus TaxID=180088 RepID=A0A1J8Q452_9AGAM|nr:hypothetical protein AZE42_04024 [Rhizopogon vesiculosus]
MAVGLSKRSGGADASGVASAKGSRRCVSRTPEGVVQPLAKGS